MANIKLEDLYFSKDKLKDMIPLVAKKKEISRTIKTNQIINCMRFSRNNLKIRKE